jgi:thioredoxin-like negative regulator of GroEL
MNCQPSEIIDERSFPSRVLEPPHATLVLFTARDCLPCGFLARRLPALAADLSGAIDIVRCPVEASPRTVHRYSVARTPTFLLFMAGGLVASRVGPASLDAVTLAARSPAPVV